MSKNLAEEYWKKNLKYLLILLSIWFTVSFGFGIILIEELNQIKIGGFKLGFWFAQQGSIYVFVTLIFIYIYLMNRLDKKYHSHDSDPANVRRQRPCGSRRTRRRSVGSRSRGAARGAWGGATPPEMVWTRPHGGMERIETISGGGGSPRHPTATVGTKRRQSSARWTRRFRAPPRNPPPWMRRDR